jgi:hypothetical protein
MLEPNRDRMADYVRLITGDPKVVVHMRFLPESGSAEEKRVIALDNDKRQAAREGGDLDWRKRFAVKRNFTGTLAELWPLIEQYQNGTALEGQLSGWGIFLFVNDGGHNDGSITRVRALFIDQDNYKPGVTPDWHMMPDFICRCSETRHHAFWLVADCPVDKFREFNSRLAHYYGSDPAVCNPARVMRLPGSIHQKGEPVEVELIPMRSEFDGDAYTVDQVMQGIPELPRTEPKAPGETDGKPVSRADFLEVVSYLDPEEHEPGWFLNLAAMHKTPLEDDPDGKVRLRLAHEYSEGTRHHDGKFLTGLPKNY